MRKIINHTQFLSAIAAFIVLLGALTEKCAMAQPFPDSLWSYGGQQVFDISTKVTAMLALAGGDVLSSISNGELIQHDPNGNTANSINISTEHPYYPTDMIFDVDSSILVIADINTSDPGTDFVLIRINRELEIVATQEFGFTERNLSTNLIRTIDNGYAIAGYEHRYSPNDAYLPWIAKLDSTLELQWKHNIPIGFVRIRTTGLGQNEPGEYFISGWGGSDNRFIFCKTDSVGTVIWSRDYANTYIPWKYLPWKNGHHLMVGQTGLNGIILELDEDGIEQNRQTFQLPFVGATLTQDGGLVTTNVSFAISKFDSLLQPQWVASVNRPAFDEEAWEVVEATDRRIVAGGFAMDYDESYPDKFIVSTGPDFGGAETDSLALRIVPVGDTVRLRWNGRANERARYRICESATSDGAYSLLAETTENEFVVPAQFSERFFRVQRLNSMVVPYR